MSVVKMSARQAYPVVERLLAAAVDCCEAIEREDSHAELFAEVLLANALNALLAVRTIVKWIDRPFAQRWGSPLVGLHAEMSAREARVRERWTKLADAQVAKLRSPGA